MSRHGSGYLIYGGISTEISDPSEAMDGKKMVALLLEDRSIFATRLIPIFRDSNEAFTGLSVDGSLDFGDSEEPPCTRGRGLAEAIADYLGFGMLPRSWPFGRGSVYSFGVIVSKCPSMKRTESFPSIRKPSMSLDCRSPAE